MLKQIKKMVRDILSKIFGEKLFIFYHRILANIAAFVFSNPSKKMLIVTVTGTKGKTSTLNFLWHVLTAGGYKVGMISTANIKIGNKEIPNWYHMTMPGRFLLQKFLWQMHKERCDIVLVEVTSEGIKMGRLEKIFYDVAIFTNLHPEHLKSHGNSFENYRNTKGILFNNLGKLPTKRWNGIDLPKIIIANADDENFHYFSDFQADKKYSYGEMNGDFRFNAIVENNFGVKFTMGEIEYELSLLGKFNIYNCIPAILLAKYLEIDDNKIKEGLKNCVNIPGRMELINEGQNFTAIVDYAHEAVSMENAIKAVLPSKKNKDNKLIVVFGGDGGGREPRTEMVKVISENADIGIITLSDPFDTDPQEINNFLMEKAISFGMKKDINIFETIDRRAAIKKAIYMASEGDVILFCCKGAEQTIIFPDRVEPWDDRQEVRLALQEFLAHKDVL